MHENVNVRCALGRILETLLEVNLILLDDFSQGPFLGVRNYVSKQSHLSLVVCHQPEFVLCMEAD